MSGSNKQHAFEKGDMVRLRVSPRIAGQVVAESEWGASYGVRLAGSIDIEWFEVEELEFVPVREAAAQANIVPVDFTKARALRATTKTRGAA